MELRLGLTGPLDREHQAEYHLQLVATDGGYPPRSGTMDINIVVSDSNDNSPQFTQDIYEVTVPEDMLVGVVICTVTAEDADLGTSGHVQYVMSPQSAQWSHVFSVDNGTGEIRLIQSLDHEVTSLYQLVINACDLGPDPIPSSTEVLINVKDVNDNDPAITVDGVVRGGVVEVMENLPSDTVVAHIFVEDSDDGDNGLVVCTLNSNDFYITKVYGNMFQLKTRRMLDREVTPAHHLTVTCTDGGSPSLRAVQNFDVLIQDHNDHPPVFNLVTYVASIQEGNSVGVPIQVLNATDKDIGINSELTYHVVGNSDGLFVDANTGIISTAKEFDYERQREYRIEVMARDGGNPAQSAITDVIVYIININDEPPMFLSQSYDFSVSEDADSGTYVGKVDTINIDIAATNDTYYYLDSSDSAGLFQIGIYNGEIRTVRPLDREIHDEHVLTVSAMNSLPTGPRSSVVLRVRVTDVNDNSPQITFPTRWNITVNVSNSVKSGEECFLVRATDPDAGHNGELTFALDQNGSEGLFYIDPDTGSVRASNDLRRADKRSYALVIYARDHGSPPLTSVVETEVKLHSRGNDKPNLLAMSHGGLEQNEVVVIAIAIVTAMVVTLLLVAIVVVRRSNNQRNQMMNRKLRHHLMTMEGETDTVSSTSDVKSNRDDMAVFTDESKLQYTKPNVSIISFVHQTK